MIMLTLPEINNFSVAYELVRAGLRISIIQWLTNVDVKKLRTWWHEVHNKKPPNGKQKETVLGFVKCNKDVARLTAFVLVYRKSHKKLSGEHLLRAWQEYCPRFGYIDINAAYYVVRDLFSGIVRFSHCCLCGATFVYDKGNRHTEKCPFCNTAEDD